MTSQTNRLQEERDALLETLLAATSERDRYAERLAAVVKVMATDEHVNRALKPIVNPRAPLAFEAQCSAMRKALIAQLQNSEHMQSVLSNTMGMDVTQGPLQDEAKVLRQALDGSAGAKLLGRLVLLKACLANLVETSSEETEAREEARAALAEEDV